MRYTDSPCGDIWIASGAVTISVTVVDIQLSPNPLCIPLGGIASVTVTTTPPGYESNVTVSSGDPNTASVSGYSPSFMVMGLQSGSTNLLCYYGGRSCQVVCPVYVFTANLQMTGVAAGQKLTPGGYVRLNANNDNHSTVTNGVPAIRDKDTSNIADEKDLVQLTLGANGLPGNWPVTYTLSVTKTQNAHGDVSFWNVQTKQTQFTIPYSQNWTAGASPILYMEGVAEGYAEREIALTLQVVPSGASAPSTDIVNVTVTPVLQTLTVKGTSGVGPPPWQAVPGLVKVQNTYWFFSNFGTPGNTPAVNMSLYFPRFSYSSP